MDGETIQESKTKTKTKKKSWKIIFRLRFLRISFSFLVCVVIFPAFNGNRLCPCSLCLVCVHINIGKKKNFILPRKIRTKNGRRFVVGHQRHKQHIFSIKISKENFRQFSSSFFLKKKEEEPPLFSVEGSKQPQTPPQQHKFNEGVYSGGLPEVLEGNKKKLERKTTTYTDRVVYL